MVKASRTKGFTMIELMIVVAIIMIMMGMAVLIMGPTLQTYRLTGDARGIAGSLALARMRAASDFTRAEVCFDFTGNNCTATSPANTYQVMVWNKGLGAFQPELASAPQALSQGDIFVPRCPAANCFPAGMPPLGGQGTIGQGTGGGPGPPISSVQIIFNSRGLAIDPLALPNSVPVTTNAIYITSPQISFYCAVTASIAGQQGTWKYVSNAWFQL